MRGPSLGITSRVWSGNVFQWGRACRGGVRSRTPLRTPGVDGPHRTRVPVARTDLHGRPVLLLPAGPARAKAHATWDRSTVAGTEAPVCMLGSGFSRPLSRMAEGALGLHWTAPSNSLQTPSLDVVAMATLPPRPASPLAAALSHKDVLSGLGWGRRHPQPVFRCPTVGGIACLCQVLALV